MAQVTELDVSSIVARTSRSYDALPYTSDPFPNTHPSLLGAIARLFAVDAAPLRSARVLELGCASGGNIIPLAARHPQASFVGVDLSSAQVAAGQARIAQSDTLLGFALAGGGTNWSLAQALGSGRGDTFQAGLYGITHFGPAYLAGALAFANHWFTTNRVALGDQLTAKFQGQSYAARLEGGYRYAVPVSNMVLGVTPYAALQVQDFHTPSFSETDLTGGVFGLAFNAMNATDTRSELGARFDNLQVVNNMPVILRARAAWAHDWVSNPALGAVFQTLPGSNFIVNGAAPARDSALASAGAEVFVTPNWTVSGKFLGEFASGAQTYTGTGTLRYSW